MVYQVVYGPFYSEETAREMARRKGGYFERRFDEVGPYYLVFDTGQEYERVKVGRP